MKVNMCLQKSHMSSRNKQNANLTKHKYAESMYSVRLFLVIFSLLRHVYVLQGVNRCVTSTDGKMADFVKYGASSNCVTDDQGHGAGRAMTNFVYTR